MSRYSSIDNVRRCSHCGILERDPYIATETYELVDEETQEATGKTTKRKLKRLKPQVIIKIGPDGLCNKCRKEKEKAMIAYNDLKKDMKKGIDIMSERNIKKYLKQLSENEKY